MSDPSTIRNPITRAAASLRTLLRKPAEATLRQSLEDVIEEHEATPSVGGINDLGPQQREMLRNLLDFGELRADDIAVPRADIIAFDADGSFDELVAKFNEAGHSRMPVYRESLDDVVGFIHVKDVFAHFGRDGPRPKPEALMRKVEFVPVSMRLIELLALMRQRRDHLVIVVDEYGGTDGLITIEDLVEQIIGDIEDEHDDASVEQLTADGDSAYFADARLALEELEERLGADLLPDDDDSEVDTVGGLMFMLAGRVPAVGETIDHPLGYRFKVVKGDSRRIVLVRIELPSSGVPVEIGSGG
jgi:CBS domain containing-hemolysin-like protein